ncbi:MAG: type I polyketide synthase, partial [Desulfuromonadales bacterium]|nr:type I polyketide synthase [Desulfuromonadales bacterium]
IGGPSFTLSSEDNSGLRALEVGIHSLQEGSINRAIVGAVDFAGDLRSVLSRYQSGQLVADGIIGEGAAAVVLKRLDDARQDGDRIYAVIDGVGTAIGGQVESNDPEADIYSQSVELACFDANVAMTTISYLETNDITNPVTERLEAKVLGSKIGGKGGSQTIKVGNVKGDIGNAGAAAGLAALVKTALCLHHKMLPPLRNNQSLSPEWIRGKGKFSTPTAPQYWLHNSAFGERRALVGGIGCDGSCSHLVVEEYNNTAVAGATEATCRPIGALPEGLFVLEADSQEQLLAKIRQLRQLLTDQVEPPIDNLARLWFAQSHLDSKLSFGLSLIAESSVELTFLLEQAEKSIAADPQRSIGITPEQQLNPASRERIFYSAQPLGINGKVAFVFPGSGNQFAGMGRELSARWPQIYRQQEQHSNYLADQYQADRFWGSELSETLQHDHNALVISHVAQCTALSDLVRYFGIEPEMISGYSLGESAGLFSSGAWHDRDGMLHRLAKSPLFTTELAGECRAAQRIWGLAPGRTVDWQLGMVNLPAAQIRDYLRGKKQVYLLIINTHLETVVGGNRQQVEQLVADLDCHFIPLEGVT